MGGAAHTSETKQSSTVSRSAAAAVQARLNVGPATDSYEQEADRAAEQVVGGGGGAAASTGPSAGPLAPRVSRLVRRRPIGRRKIQRQMEEEEPQMRLQRQRGTAVEEEEMRETQLQRQPEDREPQMRIQRREEELQEKVQRQEEDEEPLARVQRQAEDEEEVQARREPLPTRRDRQQFSEIERVEDKLYDSKAKGEPLPDDVRVSLEQAFGADFRGVRIHTDEDAVRMARELNAQAFTHGRHIYFNAGRYEPDTLRGRNLLAHELAHVIQQGAAEQQISPKAVEKNNARRSEPAPEPPDREAEEAEERTAETASETGVEEATEETEEAASGEGVSAADRGAGADEEVPAGEVPSEAPSAAAPSAGPAIPEETEEAAGEVGAFLRESTDAVVAEKKRNIETLAHRQKEKEDARTKVMRSEDAVEPPAREAESRAEASQVETVEQTSDPEPDKEQPRRAFEETLEGIVPETLEEVDKFKEEGKGRIVGEKVKEVVTADTQEVTTTYEQIEETPEPEPPAPAEPLPVVEIAPETPTIDPGAGVVGDVQPEHTDMSEFEEKSDALLEEEGITEEQLQMVDEGDLAEASAERQNLADKVEEAPSEVTAVQRREKERLQQDLKAEEQEGRKQMHAERQRELQRVRGDQQRTKTKFEVKRQEVTEHIEAVYERANTTVQQKLEALEDRSLKAFDEGQAKATRTFEDNVKARMEAFKEERYDRLGGGVLWVKDKLLGMEDLPQVKRIFESEQRRFVSAIDRLIEQITADNEKTVRDCKDVIADAREEIETYLDSLEPTLREAGQRAYGEMKSKLDELDRKVDEKAEDLQEKLEAKREEAIKAIEEKIEKMKEEMSGLVAKIGGLLLNAMLKFFKWVLKKAGFDAEQFIGIIDKGKAVLQKVVKDPLGFLKNLLAGVKGGIQQFMTNIKNHLVGGLVDWLTGVMSSLPIDLPEKWDLKGVLHLVLQILGLTWQRIRTKLVKRVGERVVKAAETSVDIIRRLVTEGPIALWNMIREKAAEIKQRVMETIRGWAITQLIKQGIVRLLGMLNPAGAIVQAVLAIYNAVMFFIENWERITTFARTVVDTITDIAQGKIGVVVQAIENAMAQTIPIILNFIARLLNISGISKAISSAIKKVRRPIDKIVDKAIDRMVKLARKIAAKVKKGVAAVKEKVMAWWKATKSFRADDGQTHKLYYKGKSKSARLMVASSSPMQVEPFLTKVLASINQQQGEKKRRLTRRHTDARNTYENLKSNEEKLKRTKERKKQKPLQKKIQNQMAGLAGHLKPLMGISEEELPPPILPPMVYGAKASSFTAEYINKDVPDGTEAGSYDGATLQGWRELQAAKLTRPGGYVKMHLLPHRLGGDAADSNLVPASGPKVNVPFSHGIEKEAIETKQSGEPIWYKIDVSFYSEPNHAYPQSIVGKWGTYRAQDSDWKKKSDPGGQYGKTSIDVPEVPTTLKINDPETTPGEVRAFLDIDYSFARIIVKIRQQQGKYAGDGDLVTKMELRHEENQRKNRRTVADFDGKMSRLRRALADNQGDVKY